MLFQLMVLEVMQSFHNDRTL